MPKKQWHEMTRKEQKYAESKQIIRCDSAFSKYVRLRDKFCVTCGSVDNLQCSHLYAKKQHKSVRWDERNAYAQCAKCHFKHHQSDPFFYSQWAKDTLGQEFDLLTIKAKSASFLSYQDLLEIEIHYITKAAWL